jgi:hypothetical protein
MVLVTHAPVLYACLVIRVNVTTHLHWVIPVPSEDRAEVGSLRNGSDKREYIRMSVPPQVCRTSWS